MSGYESTTAANWLMGPGVPYDRWTVAPGPADDLYFRGDVSGSEPCTIPQPTVSAGQNAFAGIHLLFGQPPGTNPPDGIPTPPPPPVGYWGTVTTAGGFAVGALTVECGAIAQADPVTTGQSPAHAGTLTVNSALLWTGGTLNSNTVAGNIDLAPGAGGTAAPSFDRPEINGTVYLGSTLTLLGNETTGRALDILGGTYNMTGGKGLVVQTKCNLRLMPTPVDPPPGGGGGQPPPPIKGDVKFSDVGTVKDGKNNITVEKGSTATFLPESRADGSTALARFNAPEGALVNKGGTVVIVDYTEVVFGGATVKDTNNTVWSIKETSGHPTSVFRIEAGCRVVTKNGFGVGDGVLQLFPATGTAAATETEAFVGLLNGSTAPYALLITGTASVSMPSPPSRTLVVDGNFGLGRWFDHFGCPCSQRDIRRHDPCDR